MLTMVVAALIVAMILLCALLVFMACVSRLIAERSAALASFELETLAAVPPALHEGIVAVSYADFDSWPLEALVSRDVRFE
jgi:branched-subunit amino acid transport protein